MKTLLRLYHDAVHVSKRNFTSGELSLMIDVMQSTYLDTTTISEVLLTNMEDCFTRIPGIEEKWGVADIEKTIEKLKALSPFHAACLANWISSFWFGNSVDEPAGDLNEYLRGPNIAGELQNALSHLTTSIDLQEKTRSAFKSKTIAQAREHTVKALEILEMLA